MSSVVLISTYDLGRQPFGLASPAAWLREAGIKVTCADLSRTRLPQDAVATASLVGFFLPMHTATRLALPVIDRVRRINPSATLVAYGLYAPLNEVLLRERGVHEILGGEFEQDLLLIASAEGRLKPTPASEPVRAEAGLSRPVLGTRIIFKQPSRDGLPPLEKYAQLQVGSERRVVGYTEASRGCKHR
jgi:radical SAM superfamily enzyme YgiQ (UPF0313 family)